MRHARRERTRGIRGRGRTGAHRHPPDRHRTVREVNVVVPDEHDHINRTEYFPKDQWTEALARFEKLATEDESVLENRPTLAGRRAMDAFTRGDPAATTTLGEWAAAPDNQEEP